MWICDPNSKYNLSAAIGEEKLECDVVTCYRRYHLSSTNSPLQQDAISFKMHLSREASILKASSSSKVVSWPVDNISSIVLLIYKDFTWIYSAVEVIKFPFPVPEPNLHVGKLKCTWERCRFCTINSFSRLSAPRSEDARGNERSIKLRTGLGMTWIRNKCNIKACWTCWFF